ncbi:hypothetical protein GYMLUDRAFT_245679 [Collybiopsis luxurians FD-317 M1]|uniref:Uncharacterized protein n=1 Tax=Collybiopsis luxurians FD-317 M1 TaxID=944289 RepID=A0A0D0B674_9AGAR|nr:hypothetical protein GYMLUDRAFT_245679 [Collybiopsis luxurians FD-317 M1]
MSQIPVPDLKKLINNVWRKGVLDSDKSAPLYEDDEDGEAKQDDDNDNDEVELVCFVPWDEEQMSLLVRDLGHVPIIQAAWKDGEDIGQLLCLTLTDDHEDNEEGEVVAL